MYYFDDGNVFSSKIKAIEYSLKTNSTVNFYYYDEIYDKVNWKVEPNKTLQECYKEQALRLREKYDYLVLCFSGGLDSTNILETFYYNNIKLDKIVIAGAFSQDSSSKSDENMNIEAYTSAFPHIEKLGLASITEKIDYTDYFYDINNLSISVYGNEWIDNIGGWYSPNNFFWRDMENYAIPHSMRDRKSAMIFGKEKPRLYYEDGKLVFKFSDVWFNCYGGSYGNEFCDRISFYMDPFFTDILVKQVHVLKRALHLMYTNNNKEITEESCNTLYKMIHDVTKTPEGGMKNFIYDMKHSIPHKSPKSPSRIISSRDTFLKKKHNSELFSFYKSGIQNMKRRIVNMKNEKIITSKAYEI